MKIANENTFQQFDRLRQQIFAHKQQQLKQKKPVSNPFSAKFRSLLPLSVLVGAGWLIYRNLSALKDYLVENKIVSYQQYLVFESVKTYLKCKSSQLLEYPHGQSNPNLATDIYLTKLESDYLYLKQKMPERLLDSRSKTSFSFWIFNWGVEETVHLINSYGDLVMRKKNYKFSLAGLLNVGGKTEETVIKQNKIFEYYLTARKSKEILNNCHLVNALPKLQYSNDQYEKVLTYCRERELKINTKLQEFIIERLKSQNARAQANK